ncbi:hypothetical protein [Dokdonella sp.]|uniref:hypothetical protein n=1 Tax=Dokdonella sp. TaxID=2291710 RepID=UPI001B11FA1F|nr:hypothetical protein [Dokdonella sp.]MBO9661331.1 hypothetical protein [Dokdonella sp.]
MNSRLLWGCVLVLVASGAANAAEQAAKKPGASIDVSVRLTKRAAAKLAGAHESIGLSAVFFGDPNNESARRAAAEDGRVALGVVDRQLAKAGRVRIAPPAFDAATLASIGPAGPRVNINVFSARKSLPDNVLDCDFFEDRLAVALRKPIVLRCALIGERAPAKAAE